MLIQSKSIMRSSKIKVFYTPKQVLKQDAKRNFSKSPMKPKLLLEYLEEKGLIDNFEIVSGFRPFSNNEFMIAHTKDYVEGFFNGAPIARSNSLDWSEQFANSVRYTNASLFEAIRNSLVHPEQVSFSPTSGFHHATPNAGRGFCTFSGQVIASVKLYRTYGSVGAYVDLDGHYGNSIEDARGFNKDINKAVPVGFNFNPHGYDQQYYNQLMKFLTRKLQPAILAGKIDYVVFCHGADSHEADMLHGQCSTEFWVKCSKFFWSWVKDMDELLGRPLPVSCSLFGGYRQDDYTSVLSLHTTDLVECMRNLLGLEIDYTTEVTELPKYEPPSWSTPYSQSNNNYMSRSYIKPSERHYIPSTDMGVRKQNLNRAEQVMREQREKEAERDRLNEEEFEKFYRIRVQRMEDKG